MHDFCTPNADEMNYSELAEKVRYHIGSDGEAVKSRETTF